MAKVTRTEIHGVLFRVVYPFVEQKYLHLPFFEKSTGSTAVQPQIRQQKRERLTQRKTAFHDLLLATERRIGNDHIPLRRLILEEVLPHEDMREDDLVPCLFQRDDKLAVLGIERTPDDGVPWQELDNRQYRMTRRVLLVAERMFLVSYVNHNCTSSSSLLSLLNELCKALHNDFNNDNSEEGTETITP